MGDAGQVRVSSVECRGKSEHPFEELRALAQTFPSQGGVEIGPWLERLAAHVPPGAAIVEVGSWLGAGTAQLALGAMISKAPIHVYDRFQASAEEVEKAARFGVELMVGMDTLPLVMDNLAPFPGDFTFHKSSIKFMQWDQTPIGLYVDDATKVEPLWLQAMAVFKPHFIPGKTHLVLMDYFFFEKAGPKYAAQYDFMKAHTNSFKLLEERLAGTTAATFLYLG